MGCGASTEEQKTKSKKDKKKEKKEKNKDTSSSPSTKGKRDKKKEPPREEDEEEEPQPGLTRRDSITSQSPDGRRDDDGLHGKNSPRGSIYLKKNLLDNGNGKKDDDDPDANSVAMSDAESTMTTESFFEVLGKKVNRPRSAKGHSAEQPTMAAMTERILAHALKGSLNGVDGEVEDAFPIYESQWATYLRKRRAPKDAANGNGSGNGVAAAAVTNVDDICSVVSHARGPEAEAHPGDDDSDDGLAKSSSVKDDVFYLGRALFGGREAYYDRIIKPWAMEFLTGEQEIDPSLSTEPGPEDEGGVSPTKDLSNGIDWDRSFAQSVSNFGGRDSKSSAHTSGMTASAVSLGDPTLTPKDPVVADGEACVVNPEGQMAEDDVLRMMM